MTANPLSFLLSWIGAPEDSKGKQLWALYNYILDLEDQIRAIAPEWNLTKRSIEARRIAYEKTGVPVEDDRIV